MFGNYLWLALFAALIAFGFGDYNLKLRLASIFSSKNSLLIMGLLPDHKLIINAIVEEVMKHDDDQSGSS